jgi:hypothetical protein
MHARALLLLLAIGCGGPPRPEDGSAEHRASEACAGVSKEEATTLQAVLLDPQDRFKGAYPAAPALTCPILQGLEAELADPSVRVRYESLSADHWADHARWAETIESLGRDSRRYTLIALSTHWNTDQKILALRAFQRVPSRLLIHTDAAGQATLAATEQAALRFLLHVFETTPRVISGSENATIHGVYMDALVFTLDLLSGERSKTGAARTNAMTDAEVTEAIASWRRHLAP